MSEKFEAAQIYYLTEVYAAVAEVVPKLPKMFQCSQQGESDFAVVSVCSGRSGHSVR